MSVTCYDSRNNTHAYPSVVNSKISVCPQTPRLPPIVTHRPEGTWGWSNLGNGGNLGNPKGQDRLNLHG